MLVSNSLPNSLTDCCLVNLIDVTLACEDANSKLVEVVTVADVDSEDHVMTKPQLPNLHQTVVNMSNSNNLNKF